MPSWELSTVYALPGLRSADGPQDVVLPQSFYELENIRPHDLLVHLILAADLFCDLRLIEPLLHEVQNSCGDRVEREHLTAVDIEQDSAVWSVRRSNCCGYLEHMASRAMNRLRSHGAHCRTSSGRLPEAGPFVRIKRRRALSF